MGSNAKISWASVTDKPNTTQYNTHNTSLEKYWLRYQYNPGLYTGTIIATVVWVY